MCRNIGSGIALAAIFPCVGALAWGSVFIPYMAVVVIQGFCGFVDSPSPFIVLRVQCKPGAKWSGKSGAVRFGVHPKYHFCPFLPCGRSGFGLSGPV